MFSGTSPHLLRSQRLPALLVKYRVIAAILFVGFPLLWAIGDLTTDAPNRNQTYIVPLCDQFVVRASEMTDPNKLAVGPFQLVRYETLKQLMSWEDLYSISDHSVGPNRTPTDATWCIPCVTEIGLQSGIIFGHTSTGYFVLDARKVTLTFYRTFSELTSALNSARIVKVRLEDPVQLAGALPPEVIRPWAYVYMNVLWGQTDGWWSTLVFQSGLLFSYSMGLLLFSGRFTWVKVCSSLAIVATTIWLALYLNKVANYYEQGPTMFIESILKPPVYLCALIWGILVRKMIVALFRAGYPKLSHT